jgi:hypothetical protein
MKKNRPTDERTPRQRPQDVQDPRTKNMGHKKKTADKWNQ